MRVFITGGSGFVGLAVTADLIAAGHQVLGMTRSDEGAKALADAGAEPYRGTLEDLDGLKRGAAQSDGVIHLAFNHDFSTYMANCEADRVVIEALGSVLAGSERPLLVTSGAGLGATPGHLAIEDNPPIPATQSPRAATEEAAEAVASQGVRVSVVRLPQVHDTEKQGLISYAVEVAREKGVSAYVGDGANRWAAAARFDVARLYRLAIEKAAPFARYHAVGEEGVAMRDVAETLGRRLGLPVASIAPEEAPAHFGWLGMFANLHMPASSAQTRERLGWTPTGPSLLEDLEQLRLPAV